MSIVLISFDDPRKDHVMLGADGFWVLIGRTGKCYKVFSQVTQRYNFIRQTELCAEEDVLQRSQGSLEL